MELTFLIFKLVIRQSSTFIVEKIFYQNLLPFYFMGLNLLDDRLKVLEYIQFEVYTTTSLSLIYGIQKYSTFLDV